MWSFNSIIFNNSAFAQSKNSAFKTLMNETKKESLKKNSDAWSYIISGGIAVAVTTPAYYLSSDPFAKIIYLFGQTVGTIALSDGISRLLNYNESERFYRILMSDKTLTNSQKNNLSYQFFLEEANRAKSQRTIKATAHLISGVFNVANSFAVSNSELRLALLFIGGINFIAAGNYAFFDSNEEKRFEKFDDKSTNISFFIGPSSGVVIKF